MRTIAFRIFLPIALLTALIGLPFQGSTATQATATFVVG